MCKQMTHSINTIEIWPPAAETMWALAEPGTATTRRADLILANTNKAAAAEAAADEGASTYSSSTSCIHDLQDGEFPSGK